MTEIKVQIEKLVEQLKQERDELRVRAHLARSEVAEEWEKLEEKLFHLEARAKELKDASADAAKDIGAAAGLLAEEVRKGFESVRKHI